MNMSEMSMAEAVRALHNGLISQDDYDRYCDEWNAARIRRDRANWDYAEKMGLTHDYPRP